MLSIDIPFLIFLLYLFGFQADFLLCAFAFSLGGKIESQLHITVLIYMFNSTFTMTLVCVTPSLKRN